MQWYGVVVLVITVVGAILSIYQIFKLIELDARSRGLKRPKFWGLFASGAQNGSGLILYLIGRSKYPSTLTAEGKIEMEQRKGFFSLTFSIFTLGALAFLAILVFGT